MPRYIIVLMLLTVASVRSPGQPPPAIHRAVRDGDINLLNKILLKDPKQVNRRNENGETPLHWAAIQGNPKVINILMAFGADVSARDNTLGGTPLHWAAIHDKLEVIKLLLANKADVNETTNDGWTPLHIAAYQGHKDVADFLVAFGADIEIKDNEGMTPLERATEKGSGIVELLVAKGADFETPVPSEDGAVSTSPPPATTEDVVETDDLEVIEMERARVTATQDVTEGRIRQLKDRIFDLEKGIEDADAAMSEVRETIEATRVRDNELEEQRKEEIEKIRKDRDSTIVRLRAELTRAETRMFNLERRLREAEKYKIDLEAEKKLSRELWLKTSDNAKELDALRKSSRLDNEHAEKRIRSLKKQVVDLESRNAELQRENNQLKLNIRQAGTRIDGLKELKDKNIKQAKTNEVEVARLQRALLAAAQTINEQEQKLDQAKTESLALQKLCDDRESIISRQSGKIDELNSQLETASQIRAETVIDTESRIEAADTEVSDLQNKIENLQKEIKGLEKQIADQQTENQKLSEKVTAEHKSKLQVEKEQLAALNEVRNTRRRFSELQDELDRATAEIAKLKQENQLTERLKHDLAEQKTLVTRLQKIIDAESMVRIKSESELEAREKEYRKEKEELNRRIVGLEAELHARVKENARATKSLAAHAKEIESLRETNSSLERQKASAEKTADAFSGKITSLKKNIAELSVALARAEGIQARLEQAQNEIDDLRKKSRLETSARTVAEMNAAAQKEASDQAIIELERQTARLERQIRELKSNGRRLWNMLDEVASSSGRPDALKERRALELREAFRETGQGESQPGPE